MNAQKLIGKVEIIVGRKVRFVKYNLTQFFGLVQKFAYQFKIGRKLDFIDQALPKRTKAIILQYPANGIKSCLLLIIFWKNHIKRLIGKDKKRGCPTYETTSIFNRYFIKFP